MAIIYNSGTPTQTTTQQTLSGNSYDSVRAFAIQRASDPIIVDELIEAYVAIALSLNITPVQFIQLVESQGSSQQQDIYLASALNSIRVKNALLGIGLAKQTPNFIIREIQP